MQWILMLWQRLMSNASAALFILLSISLLLMCVLQATPALHL